MSSKEAITKAGRTGELYLTKRKKAYHLIEIIGSRLKKKVGSNLFTPQSYQIENSLHGFVHGVEGAIFILTVEIHATGK